MTDGGGRAVGAPFGVAGEDVGAGGEAAAPDRVQARVQAGARKRTWTQAQPRTRWSKALGAAICARVAAGELLYEVCREPGMPTAQAVGRWARENPAFGAALRAARRRGGRSLRGGGVWSYRAETAEEVFERLCEGEGLSAIAADPAMPSLSTLFHWRRNFPEFDAAVRLGMQAQAELACDHGWELAQAATPETAYLTQVRLGHLRWMAGVKAPRQFRPKQADPPQEAAPARRVLLRRFEVEVDPQTGRRTVVAYCPNPDTGQVEREDTPGWRQAPDSLGMPGGRGS
ncbi:hypothetical protein [Phenylobacterium sp.]|uniref:terminase small subunit-like protein n=1 Tax=Phenylobacterium sp. TaxID=1871053 RepID=UPI00301E1D88